MKPNARFLALALALAGLLATVCASAIIGASAHGRTFRSVEAIPHRRVGVVLGCGKRLTAGKENLFFKNRVRAAAALFEAGKVDYLLVSGDNHVASYNESMDMKGSLIRLGVPAERIYCDFAGFRTLDSIVRAREVFGQSRFTVISQEFHNQRAIFIARHRSIDAIGFDADDVAARSGFTAMCREQFARVRTLLDVYLLRTGPRFLGPRITIGEDSQSVEARGPSDD